MLTPHATIDQEPTTNIRDASVAESAGDAIMLCTATGHIADLNRSAEDLYGLGRDEAEGEPVERIFDAAQTEAGREAVLRVLAGADAATFDTRHRHADGRSIDVAVTVSPLHGPRGEIAGASLIVRDVGDRVKLARDLARTRILLEARAKELSRSNGDLEQFAYIASHDLSEPLRTITGMLALLVDETDGVLDEDAEDYVRRAVAGADRMRALIDDLLTYSRVGRREAERRELDLRGVIDESLEGLGSVIASSGGRVTVVALTATVQADPVELRQVLQNLVSNSLKFNTSAAPSVELSARRDGAAWRVTVADDGIGIAPEFAERVFGPFKRLHPRDAYPGTGIGLAICRRIVERRDGRIWVEHLADGTAVHFTIPDAPSASEATS